MTEIGMKSYDVKSLADKASGRAVCLAVAYCLALRAVKGPQSRNQFEARVFASGAFAEPKCDDKQIGGGGNAIRQLVSAGLMTRHEKNGVTPLARIAGCLAHDATAKLRDMSVDKIEAACVAAVNGLPCSADTVFGESVNRKQISTLDLSSKAKDIAKRFTQADVYTLIESLKPKTDKKAKG